MAKIKLIGNGFIEVDGKSYNVKAYKNVERYSFGHNEDPDGKSAFGITFTPISPSEENVRNGVNGSFFIKTYTADQKENFEKDYEIIASALKD
ncbi:hypothetical protein ACFE6N_02710 [Pedobacter sp. BG31]|uniref:hypothetical protein n=1 Tax=Pedobacter sp. BG31 TaxID=3349697 RepID=UPI0035F3EC53